MSKSVLFTTFAAAALALGLAACDEQQASESSPAPMQQQGAVPEGSSNTGGTSTPMAPDSSEPSAAPPEMEQPEGSAPDSTMPGSSQPGSSQEARCRLAIAGTPAGPFALWRDDGPPEHPCNAGTSPAVE